MSHSTHKQRVETAIDHRFNQFCSQQSFLYFPLCIVDAAFLVLIVYLFVGGGRVDLSLAPFALLLAVDIVLHLYEMFLLTRRVTGVVRMMRIRKPASARSDATRVSTLDQFKLLTHSATLSRWIALTLVGAYVTFVLLLLALFLDALVFFDARHWLVLAPLALWQLAKLALLRHTVTHFWRRAVVGSVLDELPSNEALNNYALACASIVVQRIRASSKSAAAVAAAAAESSRRSLQAPLIFDTPASAANMCQYGPPSIAASAAGARAPATSGTEAKRSKKGN